MERLCGKQHAFVEARQLDIDATVAQELNRRKMQSIERADDDRKWFERSGEKLGIEFDEIDAAEQFAHRIMETREPARVDSIPDLIFKQSARYELFVPKRIRHASRLDKNTGERNRAVKVNHGRRAPRRGLSVILPVS